MIHETDAAVAPVEGFEAAYLSDDGTERRVPLSPASSATCNAAWVSTRRADRPKPAKTVASLKAGDRLVITKPDRVARSMKELLIFLEDELAPRGVPMRVACAS